MNVNDLLAQPQHLPTLPALLARLIDSFSDEDVAVDDIARDIGLDAALTARLLRMANSAFFHQSRRIATVDEAVRMLGFVMVRNLVIAHGLATACPTVPGLDVATFWRQNLASACVARWLAGATRQNADRAFMVGLLAGIGQVVMRNALPAAMRELDKAVPLTDERRALAERGRFGFESEAVSAALAEHWHFPAELSAGIAHCAFPLEGIPDPLACIVHLARWRAAHHILGSREAVIRKTYPARVGEVLSLGPDWAIAGTRKAADSVDRMPAVVELLGGMDDLVA